jgi:hypothetical protein
MGDSIPYSFPTWFLAPWPLLKQSPPLLQREVQEDPVLYSSSNPLHIIHPLRKITVMLNIVQGDLSDSCCIL